MTRIDSCDQALLDLICSCAHRRIRIVGIKVPCRPSLRRLRYAGLVGFGDYLPSPSALLDWFERQKESTAAPAKPCEEPPGAKAAEDDGGGDARKVTPPPEKPRPKGPPSMAERNRRWEANHPNNRGASGVEGGGRERAPADGLPMAPPVRESRTPDTAAPTHSSPQPVRRASPSAAPPSGVHPEAVESEVAAVAQLPRPALEKPPRPVDIKVNIGPRDLTREPDVEVLDGADQIRARTASHGQAIRRGQEAGAARLLDSGVRPEDVDNVYTANIMREIERRRADEARLSDPVEQAKTVIRIAGYSCFSAVVNGGPAGMFYIGTKLVSREELLAKAERLRKRRA